MEFKQITYEVDDRIAFITLNRPERMNAWTVTMMSELIEAFDLADRDDAVRVIIVTGAGKAYCAGADLSPEDMKSFAEQARSGGVSRDTAGRFTLKVFDVMKPSIAAINGVAVGVGVSMTLGMDIRIASEAARFGFVFNRRGLMPEGCSTWLLPRITGFSQAAEWMYTGRVFSAWEALEGGLVSKVVRAEKLMPTVVELAREIADNTSAISTALTRQLMWKMLTADHPMKAHILESKSLGYMRSSPDCAEGVSSFFEKRPPDFKMRPSADTPDFYPWWETPLFKVD
ncbi:crotonase/enoyl-CoA hydratase family protein [Thermodesulfobacteriota bacterium]